MTWGTLIAFDACDEWIDMSFLSVPEKMRMKLIRATNGSIRVLKTCATSGPSRSGVSVTSSPGGVGRLPRQLGRRERDIRPMASISSGTPTPVFELVKKTGISVPAATAFESRGRISSA